MRAANHMRVVGHSHGNAGLQVFVYGTEGEGKGVNPKKYPARQQRDAYETIARQHRLYKDRTLFVQQHHDVIDEGIP